MRSLRADAGLELPLNSHILCAISGGLDSTALATLLARYGHRVGVRVSLLHVHHGWRGKESDGDAAFVETLARDLNVPCTVERLDPKIFGKTGDSWENVARRARRKIYARHVRSVSKCNGALVFTAHHADDLAETMIWRFFTGNLTHQPAGILPKHDFEVRPFLRVRKATLQAFLEEEGIQWREDRTNHEERFLRAKMRKKLAPVVEEIFPKAVENLVRSALDSNSAKKKLPSEEIALLSKFFRQETDQILRKEHIEQIGRQIVGKKGEISLPGAWKLRFARNADSSRKGPYEGQLSWTLDRDLEYTEK